MKKAFTLIELIIVIAIIGVLTALIMPNFMAGRIRARDAAKKSDMRSFKQALQLYYNDYQVYPEAYSSGFDISGCGDGDDPCNRESFATDTTTYLKQLPTGFRYYPDNSNDTYLIQIELENASDEDMLNTHTTCATECGNTGAACCDAGTSYYCVCPD